MKDIVLQYYSDNPAFYGYAEYRDGVYFIVLANRYQAMPKEANWVINKLINELDIKRSVA